MKSPSAANATENFAGPVGKNAQERSGRKREIVMDAWLHGSRIHALPADLQEKILSLLRSEDESSLNQIPSIFDQIIPQYSRFTDQASCKFVEHVLLKLVPPETKGVVISEKLIGCLAEEAQRISKRQSYSSHAAGDLYVLLSWSCALYTNCLARTLKFSTTPSFDVLLGAMAILLDLLLGATKAKASMQSSALKKTNWALASSPESLPLVADHLLSKINGTHSPLPFVPLLGVAINGIHTVRRTEENVSARLLPEQKKRVWSLYTNSILMSKTPVLRHIATSLSGFIRHFCQPEDLTTVILPAMDKALLRAPENSLSVIKQFFLAYDRPIDDATFSTLIKHTISAAKSTDPIVQEEALDLFKVLMANNAMSPILEEVATGLLDLSKAGKTSGPPHRTILYSMLALVPTGPLSLVVIQAAVPLLTKETNETTCLALTKALQLHMSHLLRLGVDVPPDTTAFIAKEMAVSKSTLRRALYSLIGASFWQEDALKSSAALTLAQDLFPLLLAALEVHNPNQSHVPMDLHIALALLLGPFRRHKQFGDAIHQSGVIQSLGKSPKLSLLVWDKGYLKSSDTEEELWLLRAAKVTFLFLSAELEKSEPLRRQIGMIFLELAVESRSPMIRQTTLSMLENCVKQLPGLTNRIVLDALTSFVSTQTRTAGASNEGHEYSWNKHGRLADFLLSSGAFDDEVDKLIKENLVAEFLVLGHHPLICLGSHQVWIDLCQKARIDPRELVDSKIDMLCELLQLGSPSAPQGSFVATQNAVRTMAFVSPKAAIPKIVDKLLDDIDPDRINSLGDFELGVWATPPGKTYVDVLASTKNTATDFKGKDSKLAKWEEEVRKSISTKKPTTVTMSKQEQALLHVQLEKEARVRNDMTSLKFKLERGFSFLRGLVAANVPELQIFASRLVENLLQTVSSQQGVALLGQDAFDAFLALSLCCSARLDKFSDWIGIATLRCVGAACVPETHQGEPLSNLVTRVLHRLRSLSEQAPLDVVTFAYAFPLINMILTEESMAFGEEEDPLEKTALALDILKFHCGEFADLSFPRTKILEALLHVLQQQPAFSKDASITLIYMGEAISVNPSRAEIDIILRGTLSQATHVRNACLQALQPFDLTDLDWAPELWLAVHDEDEQNASVASRIWNENGLDIPDTFFSKLVDFLRDFENTYVRGSTALSIAEAVSIWPNTLAATVSGLQEFFICKATGSTQEYDEYGLLIDRRLVHKEADSSKLAAAQALRSLAPSFPEEQVQSFFNFLLQNEVLGDNVADVRRVFLEASINAIDVLPVKPLAKLIQQFEEHLGAPSPATATADHIKEGLVVLLGAAVRHLDAADERIPNVINRLTEALKTPSEQVQITVSQCLSPLIKSIQPSPLPLADQMFDQLFRGSSYAARRGAAYGLTGIIRGTGILGMKEFNAVNRLKAAAEDKNRYESRQGAMILLETLSTTLSRLFEPYVIHILPLLLVCFGDPNAGVREASQEAARAIMANMSGYGVTQVLPSLLAGLDEKQWRTKNGSIQLLGMMAYCSPRQLSLSLPLVVPRLTDVLADSHAQVRVSANKSLRQFGEVVTNPEIQSLVPVLLKAIVDPSKTMNALSSLLKTSFKHYIDQSSLALVIPVIERGFRERSAEAKKKAAQIVGNLASLTTSNDFSPYLPGLLPLVHAVLVDPVPDARAIAARTFGALIERLGEAQFPDLVSGLLKTLRSNSSYVDRLGAAQGLSEVISALGMERLESLLPEIIANAQSPRSSVREGFMSLLVYLPATFGARFQVCLPRIIAPILSGLADSEENVREAAMRAGRMVITNFSGKAIDLLLPELENCVFTGDWRTRQSSVILIGELLSKISGIGVKSQMSELEDTVEVSESSRRALVQVLGVERRNRLLSILYIMQQDSANLVRQSSIAIWKTFVQNKPRTVREILVELLNQIIFLVSSENLEQREIAARTIIELCTKFGERILAEIVPVLNASSKSTNPRTREGVCLALCYIMESTGESQYEGHEDEIIGIVRTSLVDDELNVRSAAAKAFDALQDRLGSRAIDQTLPTLLEVLRHPGERSATVLQALKEVMTVRATVVFPVLIPSLLATPMTALNVRTLASIVNLAGSALNKRLLTIMGALANAMEGEPEEELKEAIHEASSILFASIDEEEGLNTLMLLFLGWTKNRSPKRRVTTFNFFASFCENCQIDYSSHRGDWIQRLMPSLVDPEVSVRVAAGKALESFVASVPKDQYAPLNIPLRRATRSMSTADNRTDGFNHPNPLSSIAPIIIAGLAHGHNEQREQAAYVISDLVELTEENNIKPFVVPFTGPLIRAAMPSTTHPPSVKIAILTAMLSMLIRIPVFVKPFFPQLQRTFLKGSSDPASAAVRTKAGQALGILMRHLPRPDPIITELITGIRGSEDAVASSLILALANVVASAGVGVGEKAKEACSDIIIQAFKVDHDENYTQSISSLATSMAQFHDFLRPLVQTHLAPGIPPTRLSSLIILGLLSSSELAPGYKPSTHLFPVFPLQSIAQKLQESALSEETLISQPASKAKELLEGFYDGNGQAMPES